MLDQTYLSNGFLASMSLLVLGAMVDWCVGWRWECRVLTLGRQLLHRNESLQQCPRKEAWALSVGEGEVTGEGEGEVST